MQALAKVVAHHMGGHGKSDADLMRQWQRVSRQLQRQHRSVVIPISALTAGLARHRALLFKVLADFCQIPCRLLRGQFYTGTHIFPVLSTSPWTSHADIFQHKLTKPLRRAMLSLPLPCNVHVKPATIV